MTRVDKENGFFINAVLGAHLKRIFPDANNAMEWAESKGINPTTMRDVYYKNGDCGREIFNQIVINLFDIDSKKADALIDQVKNIEPISESQRIWNSIDESELTKRRLALVARATIEIEDSLGKNKP